RSRSLQQEPSMQNKTTWVVVADEAIARILEVPRRGAELVPVEELTDPDAHAKEGDMGRGPHGRRGAPGGGGATVSASDSQEHQHAQVFARRVAHRLLELRRAGRFDELQLVAAPRFLGALRKETDVPELKGAIVGTLDKDL